MPFFVLLFLCANLKARDPVARLKEIVLINSGSANVAGVEKVYRVVAPWFEELGFKVRLRPVAKGKGAPLFVAELPGQKKDFITFVMHADTVFEPGSPFQTITQVSEHVLQGPGVIDNKGGIVVGHTALKKYLEAQKKPKYSLRVVITPSEEVGSTGFTNEFRRISGQSWMVLGLEPASEDGGIVVGRKGNVWIELEVKGKEAHAGRDHQKGVNACHIISEKIFELQKLTDYEKGLTVSVGRLEGGQDKFNIVCGFAKAKIDARVPSFAVRKEYLAKVKELLKAPEISWKIVDDSPPFSLNEASKPLVEKYLDLIEKKEGKRPVGTVSSGVGDLNSFSREGLIMMDGLGAKGRDIHTEKEWIDLRSIEERAQILADFLLSL